MGRVAGIRRIETPVDFPRGQRKTGSERPVVRVAGKRRRHHMPAAQQSRRDGLAGFKVPRDQLSAFSRNRRIASRRSVLRVPDRVAGRWSA